LFAADHRECPEHKHRQQCIAPILSSSHIILLAVLEYAEARLFQRSQERLLDTGAPGRQTLNEVPVKELHDFIHARTFFKKADPKDEVCNPVIGIADSQGQAITDTSAGLARIPTTTTPRPDDLCDPIRAT
jgi:hypothetical protein